MSRKLTRLQYEKQIIDLEWRRTCRGRVAHQWGRGSRSCYELRPRSA